jgi:ankyrin repeat protein
MMAKKKRVTLPKDFSEKAEAGDIEALKAMYGQCELHATYDGRYGMNTALHFYGVPDELVRWLVLQGLDINIENYYGCTPLYAQATIGSDTVKLLLELGADIEKPDRYGSRPLHNAANYGRTDTVRLLIARGAYIHAEKDNGQTPLASALAACRNINIPEMAEIAAMLLDAGAKVTPAMVKSVKRIGEEFEFHRENFNKDYLAETDAGLTRLYSLFEVEPIARRKMHDGVSPIHVADGSWRKQYGELWDLLIPSGGASETVQGEVVRITGRVRDELYRNGGANWDRDYRKMLDALLKHFASGAALSESELAEARKLASSIRAKGDDDDSVTDRLCELAVVWVSANPNPVPLCKPDYDR